MVSDFDHICLFADGRGTVFTRSLPGRLYPSLPGCPWEGGCFTRSSFNGSFSTPLCRRSLDQSSASSYREAPVSSRSPGSFLRSIARWLRAGFSTSSYSPFSFRSWHPDLSFEPVSICPIFDYFFPLSDGYRREISLSPSFRNIHVLPLRCHPLARPGFAAFFGVYMNILPPPPIPRLFKIASGVLRPKDPFTDGGFFFFCSPGRISGSQPYGPSLSKSTSPHIIRGHDTSDREIPRLFPSTCFLSTRVPSNRVLGRHVGRIPPAPR